MKKGNKHAAKLPELKRTEVIVFPVTKAEKEAFQKAVKRGKRSQWLRETVFKGLCMILIGGFFGAALAMQI